MEGSIQRTEMPPNVSLVLHRCMALIQLQVGHVVIQAYCSEQEVTYETRTQ